MYKHWANGVFYPPKLKQADWLGFYFEHFPTVEINASFYRLPGEPTVQSWATKAPKGFIYAVKCWRWITHIRKLQQTSRPDVELFFQRIEPMWRNLGAVLVQLPPMMKADLPRLEAFWNTLPARLGNTKLRVALEVRHESWLTDSTRSLLDKLGGSLVLHDGRAATTQTNDAPFVYIRRHGTAANQGNYREDEIRADAEMIRGFAKQGRDVYVYYNNDIGGHAVRNAKTLVQMVGASADPPSSRADH